MVIIDMKKEYVIKHKKMWSKYKKMYMNVYVFLYFVLQTVLVL